MVVLEVLHKDGYKQMHICSVRGRERERKPTHIHKQSVCCVASNVDLHCGRMHPTNQEVGAQAVILRALDCLVLFLACGG